MLGVALDEEHRLLCIDAEQMSGFSVGELWVDSFPATRRLDADQSAKFGVDGRVPEVHFEEWFDQVRRHPDVVDRKWSAIDETEASKVEELPFGLLAQMSRNLVILHALECEYLAVLAVALIFDRAKEAVQGADSLLESDRFDEAAAPALALQDARIPEFSEGLTNGVSTHAVMRDEIAVGRETCGELACVESTLHVVTNLFPQRGGRVASNLELRSQLVVLGVVSSCRRRPWCGVRRHLE